MGEENGKLIIPPSVIEIECKDVDGNDLTGSVDVLEAQFQPLVLLVGDMAENEKRAVEMFNNWLESKGITVSFTAAWTIMQEVERAFLEFKKKLQPSVRSHIDTKSTQATSLEKLTEHLEQTSQNL